MDRALVPGGELAYETSLAAGSGPPVVFLNGGLLDHRQRDAEFRPLSDGVSVIRFDARGHGTSSVPVGEFSHHLDLIALLDALGVGRVIGVGLSLGARTLIDAALVAPSRFGALVLVSPGYSGLEFEDPFVLEQHAAAGRAAQQRDVAGVVEAFLRVWVDGPRRTADAVDPAVRSRCREMAHAGLLRGAGGPGLVREVGAADRLDELTMPIQVVVGDLDSVDIERAANQIVTRALNARLAMVRDAGHPVNLDQPVVFLDVLSGFLAEHGATIKSDGRWCPSGCSSAGEVFGNREATVVGDRRVSGFDAQQLYLY
jgi:pimeloyl-ACP methyl ester carboxylesterase